MKEIDNRIFFGTSGVVSGRQKYAVVPCLPEDVAVVPSIDDRNAALAGHCRLPRQQYCQRNEDFLRIGFRTRKIHKEKNVFADRQHKIKHSGLLTMKSLKDLNNHG